jgi:hypothetical protein
MSFRAPQAPQTKTYQPRAPVLDRVLQIGMMHGAPAVLGAGTLSVLRRIATLQLELSLLLPPLAPTPEEVNPMGYASLGHVYELERRMTEWQTSVDAYQAERLRLKQDIEALIAQL